MGGVGQVVEFDGHLRAGPAGRFDGEGPLDVHRVDVSPAQRGQFGRPLLPGTVGRYVDRDGVREAEARGGERALEAAQGHGPPEVDGDGVDRQGDARSAQRGGSAQSGAGGDQDALALLDPGETDEPGPLTT